MCTLFLAGFFSLVKAQVSINKTNTPPHPSAILDMSLSGNSGLGVLIPKITIGHSTDKSQITNPANYLLVFSPSLGAAYTGLNCWYQGNWNQYLSNGAAFDLLKSRHIAQNVLFVEQSAPETVHLTSKTYGDTLHFDKKTFDSQRAYNPATDQYVVPEDGIYELICSASIEGSNGSVSGLFILEQNYYQPLNQNFVTQSNVSSGPVENIVTYMGNLNKGIGICCTIKPVGSTQTVVVKSAYMIITRY
ncbi:MAG: hypothetical protein LBQ39_11145 [Tannerellaceae bacterium]|nr:hypothetical protein [Tannerellaceae bacterium]